MHISNPPLTLPSLLLPPPRPDGSNDVYVDDTIGTMLDTPRSHNRSPFSIIAATYAIIRPNMPSDLIEREAIFSEEKLSAEGPPSTSNDILGLTINTDFLTIMLPDEK
jgi:hypothetical protein